MRDFIIILGLFFISISVPAQQIYKGLFDSQDLSHPTIHADGIFSFFIASDNELKFGNPEKAILILDNAIAQNPFFAETYLKRAKLLARLGRFSEANRDYQAAKRLNPYLSNFYNTNEKSGRINLIAFDPQAYDSLETLDLTADLDAMIKTSIEKKMEGNTTAALSEINWVFDQVQRPDAQLYNLRGGIHLLQDDFHRAVADYSQAIQIAPDVPEYYFNRGVAQLFTYDRAAACEDLEMSHRMGFERSQEKLKYFCYY